MIVVNRDDIPSWMRDCQWKTLEATAKRPEALQLMSTVANATSILTHDPRWRGVIARNEFVERDEKRKAPPWHPDDGTGDPVGLWSDQDTTRLRSWMSREYGLIFGSGDLDSVVSVVSQTNGFHPVREYLDGLKWDQVDRLSTWISTHCGASQSEYLAAVGTRWMISAVARIYEPGCQVDCTLILEGRVQGTGKSSALRALVPDPAWYSETGITMGDKDSYQSLHGIWIYLFDELDSLKRGELTKTKTFLTSPKDHYRESYGRRSKDFHRQCVFAGTTNEEQYLLDPTGNRRFWPVPTVGQIDVEGIRKIRDQLWAEAVVRYRRGERWHVDTAELRKLCEAEQADRVVSDVWEEIVGRWLESPTQEAEDDGHGGPRRRVAFSIPEPGPTVAEVLVHALGRRTDAIGRFDEMRVASVLRTLGYGRPRQVREGKNRVRRYPLASQPGTTSTLDGSDVQTTGITTESQPSQPSQPLSYDHREDGHFTSTIASSKQGGTGVPVVTDDPEYLDDILDKYPT